MKACFNIVGQRLAAAACGRRLRFPGSYIIAKNLFLAIKSPTKAAGDKPRPTVWNKKSIRQALRSNRFIKIYLRLYASPYFTCHFIFAPPNRKKNLPHMREIKESDITSRNKVTCF